MFDSSRAVEIACARAGLSQRLLAARTGISQSTLSRIMNGERLVKATELLLIADATGSTIAELSDTAIADRVELAARLSNGAASSAMRERLLHFIEVDAYLDEQGVTAA